MDDGQQRRLEVLHQLAQEQLRAQSAVKEAPSRERGDDLDVSVEPLTPGAKKSTSASTRLARGSRRGLIWTLIGGVALFAVVLTGLFARSRLLTAPTPTPTPGPENALIVTSNFNSGTVTVNGKKVEGTIPLLVRLNPGDNTITYSAPPFHDRTCQVTLSSQPDANSGSRARSVGEKCFTGAQEPPLFLNGVAVKNGFLYFQMTGDDLPTDLRNAAENALWAKLATSRTLQVPAGDYYATGTSATGRITSARAAVALQATLALARSTTAQGDVCPNPPCGGQPILPGQGGVAPPSGTWLIQDAVVAGWRFTTQGGALVAAPPAQFAGNMVEAGLTYSATAGWSVSGSALGPSITDLQTQLFSGSCNSGFSALQELIGQSSFANVGQNLSYGQSAAPTSTDGCAISVEGPNNNPLSPTSPNNKKYGHYIWRWGVLLAADAQAHTLFPFLPIAPQSEIAAVGGFAF
ncbi:MAG TPA: hypothetical protein VHR15_04595 [Ktedonobacterales bacterium]|jgi:hypothetical protein|nr:hypothetical protein [Ktedonobacterales bacterium]